MLCMVMAFLCFAFAILRGVMCQVAGPVEPECRKMGNLAIPMAFLSASAGMLLLVMNSKALSRR